MIINVLADTNSSLNINNSLLILQQFVDSQIYVTYVWKRDVWIVSTDKGVFVIYLDTSLNWNVKPLINSLKDIVRIEIVEEMNVVMLLNRSNSH